jgi:ATP-dependent DNA helicase RecQ
VRKALSGVARIHGRFGLGAAVALLRGQDDPRLRGAGLDQTSTWGILEDRAEIWLTRLLRRCVTAGWVDFWGGDRPVVILTEAGQAVMKGDRPVRMLLPPLRATASKPSRSSGSGASRSGSRAAAQSELNEVELALFEELRSHRLDVSREDGVPPYVVASDRTLREIAQILPRSLSDLQLVHGIGPSKAEKYGDGLLRVISEFSSATGSD